MGLCPILVDREGHLEQLTTALDGQGGVVTVTGPAGVGKSRVVREASVVARSRGRSVIWGRPEALSAPGPFGMIIDVIEGISASGEPASAEGARMLDELLATETPTSSGASRARRVAAQLRGLLGQFRESPIVILEDLHAVDEASVGVFFHLARSALDDGYLLIATYRPESVRLDSELGRALNVLEKERSVTRLTLSTLDDSSSMRLVRAMVSRELDQETATTIVRLGEGVPFFLEELASIAEAGGSLPEIPESLGRAIYQQLGDLSSDAITLLQVAALMEGPLDLNALAEIIGQDVEQRTLEEVQQAGALVQHGSALMFRHTLVRRAIASSIPAEVSGRLHRRIAEAIARIGADDRAWQLATLWAGAGEPGLASHYALQAGRRALGLAATGDARLAFDAALEWSTDIETTVAALEGLTAVAFREGRDVEAADYAQRVVQTLETEGRSIDAATALGRMALVLTRVNDQDGVERALDEGLALATEVGASNVVARLTAQKANFLIFYLGRFEEAERLMHDALRVGQEVGAHAIQAVTLDGIAEIASWRGDFANADRIGEDSLSHALLSEDAEAVGRTHNNHAVRLVVHGRPQIGLSVLEQGHEIMVARFGAAGVSSLSITKAWLHQMMGEPLLTLESLAHLDSIWVAWRGLAASLRVWALVERGNLAEAEVVLDHAWHEAGFSDGWTSLQEDPDRANPDVLELLPAEVSFRCATRNLPTAAGAAQLHQRLSATSGQPAEWARSAALLSRVLALGGNVAESTRFSRALDDQLARRPYPYFKACADEISGLRASAVGDGRTAAKYFAMAADRFAQCQNSIDQSRCHRLAASLLKSDPSTLEQAKERLSRARELALKSGALVELGNCEAELRGLGIRPRAGRPRRDQPKRDLTAREEQIASLVAAGASNHEIARRLFIAEATVAGYVSGTLRKLGLPGRAALAAWSAKAGLV